LSPAVAAEQEVEKSVDRHFTWAILQSFFTLGPLFET